MHSNATYDSLRLLSAPCHGTQATRRRALMAGTRMATTAMAVIILGDQAASVDSDRAAMGP